MTDDDAATAPWTVRPGTLLDVNPVARLLRDGARPIDIDGDGVADGPVDEDAAAIASRLLLLHVVLERGRLVVAEQNGAIVAASVWVPPDEALLPADLGPLLTRELHLAGVGELAASIGPPEHVRPQLEATMTGFLDSVLTSRPHLVLYAIAVVATLATVDVVTVARAVVDPVLAEGRDVLALALDDDRARLLEATGFRETSRIPLGDLNTVWIGERRLVSA